MFINRETISSFFKSFKSNNFNDGNMGIVFTLWIIFILKLCIDIMFYMENLFVSNLYAITDYIIKIILILGLGIFNYNKSRNIVNRVKKYRDIHQKQEFFYDYIGTTVIIVVITFIKIILINSLNSIYIYRDWQYAIRLEFIFILIIYVAEKVLFFVYRWLSIRKNKNTSMSIILSVFAALFTCVNAIVHISSDIINFLILFILISISLIFASKIYSWVITITTKKKIGLLIFALIAILSLGVDIVTIISQYIEPHKLSNALKPIYNVIYITFVVYSNFVFIIYSFIVLIAIILSLPTAQVIDRKTKELSSISDIYKNLVLIDSNIKFISDENAIYTQDSFQDILRNAKATINAKILWYELYNNNNNNIKLDDIDIKFYEGINIDRIKELHRDGILINTFLKINKPDVIQTLLLDKNLEKLYNKSGITSMAFIPMLLNNKRIGTVVFADKEEYKFDSEKMVLIQTFSDIMNVVYANVLNALESIKNARELEAGRNIQTKLLPQVMPNIKDYNIYFYLKFAKEVGGDYYDCVKLADGHYCLIIADVSNKGMEAAFIMAYLKGVVVTVASLALSPKELLELTFKHIRDHFPATDRFVTMTAIGIYENGNVSFARAGHTPLLAKINNECKYYTPSGALMHVFFECSRFNELLEEQKLKMNKGDICVLFTDGVNEAMNSKKEQYDFERLRLLLQNYQLPNKGNKAQNLTMEIVNQVDKFRENSEVNDDIAIISIIYDGEK